MDATEAASSSGLKRMNAFFFPSGRTKVLTERGTMLKIYLNALFICTLLDLLWTMKVRVLRSVMALLAFSVLSGWTSTENLSNLAGNLREEVDLAYFVLERTLRVFGL